MSAIIDFISACWTAICNFFVKLGAGLVKGWRVTLVASSVIIYAVDRFCQVSVRLVVGAFHAVESLVTQTGDIASRLQSQAASSPIMDILDACNAVFPLQESISCLVTYLSVLGLLVLYRTAATWIRGA